MIDFHTHIIPNIDDGSKSVEETFNLIKEAEKAGFDTIISTSHYMEGYFETSNEEKRIWINTLNQKLKEQNINVQLYLGNEIYLTKNITQLLENDRASSINNSNYVLFEMPLNAKPLDLYDIIYEMLSRKIIPVLAHPERYTFVQKDIELIYDLIDKGVLMQMNFGSITGFYGSKVQNTAKKLLVRDMVHFFGSDVHKQNTIYPQIPKILDTLKKYIDEEKIKELTEINPNLALNNKAIDIPEPIRLKKHGFGVFNKIS